MRIKALAASALAATTIIGFGSTAFADTAPPSNASGAASSGSCNSDSEWPAYVQGEPANFKAGSDGVYLWHYTKGGWGLRVSHPRLPGKANHVDFTGTISTAGTFGNVKRIDLEKNDSVTVGSNGHTLTFDFNNYGGIDGVDFTTTCTPGLKVELKADSGRVQTSYIHLGTNESHPGANPFLIRRVSSDTRTSSTSNSSQPPTSN
ncbi:MAG TPA: hypothetical protein VNF50_12240 [Acidimicrobiales bacterium]|nr:hypothetical protein [Acidimicrobiales bacterium]